MATMNINTDVEDAFYRYKMPALVTKIEGKGNGIKTVIVNMADVAKSLHRPATYSTKYFGCELGALVQMDSKNERFIVRGPHDAPKLQGLLDGFIKRFVLCQECGNPETNLEVTKRQTINQICIACGHRGSIDMRHKLTTFILKNPPVADGTAMTTQTPSKGKGKGKGRSTAQSTAQSVDDDTIPGAADMNGSVVVSPVTDEGAPDDDWSVDTTPDAVKRRQTTLSSAAASLAITDDLELSDNERLERLFAFAKKQQEAGKLTATNRAIFEEAKRLDLLEKGVFIVCEVILDQDVLKQMKEYRTFLLHFLGEKKKAQRHFLGAIEKLAGVRHPELLPRVPHMLKQSYDLDLVDEEVLIEWNDKISKRHVDRKIAEAVREHAKPFITWLKEADEESSEEEEEDGVEVVYTNKSQAQVEREEREKLKVEAAAAGKGTDDEEEDDDLDIDNI